MAYDIVRKLRQMVAKAASTPSPEEAETIMSMVRKLLDAHGISLLTITATAASDDPVEVDRDVGSYWASDGWFRRVSHALGIYYGVKVIWQEGGNKTRIHIVGRESCRVAYSLMLPYLKSAVTRTAKRGWREGRYASYSRARYQIGNALSYRVYALAQEHAEAVTHPGRRGGENMLVPVDEIEMVTETELGFVRNLRNTGRAVKLSSSAIEDAKTISLAEQLRDPEFEKRLALPRIDPKDVHKKRRPPYPAEENR